MNTFESQRTLFTDFYNEVRRKYLSAINAGNRGHGFDHDAMVSSIALRIAPSLRLGQKSWCAGMLHSFDRMYKKEEIKDLMNDCTGHLSLFFSPKEREEIVEAAYRHDELNQDDQSETQIVLMDADRLANMQLSVTIRAGQFRPEIPAIDLKYLDGYIDPLSNYDNPRSVLDNLRLIIIRFVPNLRTQKAKEIGSVYAIRLEEYIKSIEQDYKDMGISGIDF